MPPTTEISASNFEDGASWEDVELALRNFADDFEVDSEVLITAVSETVNSIINGEDER